MEPISVNDIAIEPEAIAAEVQNHPAETPDRARNAAALALVVRELLLQRAREIDLEPEPATDEDGRRETDDEALIRQLLDKEVTTPDADETACRRFYDNNRQRFQSPDLFQAAHILFSADPEDKAAYARATEQASALIATLQDAPGKFSELARAHSACPSAAQGGNLGQVSKGQTVPEFETFLFNLENGQLCPVPVKSRYGVHVLRLDRKIAGKLLPFEHVAGRIAEYLVDSSWRLGVAQYIRLLAGQADIRGIALDGTDSPLVQ